MTVDDTAATIAAVLHEHERLTLTTHDLRKHCACGWASEERVGIAAHRAHIAAAICAALGHDDEAGG